MYILFFNTSCRLMSKAFSAENIYSTLIFKAGMFAFVGSRRQQWLSVLVSCKEAHMLWKSFESSSITVAPFSCSKPEDLWVFHYPTISLPSPFCLMMTYLGCQTKNCMGFFGKWRMCMNCPRLQCAPVLSLPQTSWPMFKLNSTLLQKACMWRLSLTLYPMYNLVHSLVLFAWMFCL